VQSAVGSRQSAVGIARNNCDVSGIRRTQFLRHREAETPRSRRNIAGLGIAQKASMKEPSPARKRTLALHERAIMFSTNVNRSYPEQMNYPSEIVWNQLVRAADGTSNNLIEADNGSTDPDFLNKMRTALREAKESKACLAKIRLGPLANAPKVLALGLEQEADELAAIYSTIITNMEIRLSKRPRQRRRKPADDSTED
jgi:four helix bundle protein